MRNFAADDHWARKNGKKLSSHFPHPLPHPLRLLVSNLFRIHLFRTLPLPFFPRRRLRRPHTHRHTSLIPLALHSALDLLFRILPAGVAAFDLVPISRDAW